MIESTLRQKFEMIYRNHSHNPELAFETMEKVAREQLTDELFKAASSLLDPGTRVQTEVHEYHRGLAELVQRFTGSDDLDDVAEIISEGTGIYRVTEQDFAIAIGGDALYIGPLQPAMEYIKRECEWTVKQTADDRVLVELDGGNCFGTHSSPEMAWRYAIAAELYGNTGDTFRPFLLR